MQVIITSFSLTKLTSLAVCAEFQAALGACDKIGRAHELCQVAESFPSLVVNDAFESLMDSRIVTKIKKVTTCFSEVAAHKIQF